MILTVAVVYFYGVNRRTVTKIRPIFVVVGDITTFEVLSLSIYICVYIYFNIYLEVYMYIYTCKSLLMKLVID